jgi:membrane-associated protease RseP (regulator of RpoE activity)
MNKEYRRILLQLFLFVATFFSTTLAGAEFCFGKSIYAYDKTGSFIGINSDFTSVDFWNGALFSIPFLFILTVHEFGHYFTAKYHGVNSSLPYYIPFPPFPNFPSLIGTMGAVIRLRSRVHSNVHHFDIGLAGPLAGFIVAIAVLFYGFTNLPEPEYVFQFHPEYAQYGKNYADTVYTDEYIAKQGGALEILIGSNIVFEFFKHFVADPERMPNPHEIMHYPILMAGFIALFFTALNLLPIGQLDGGHIVYGLFGKKGHSIIASGFYIALLFYAGLGMVHAISDRYYIFPPYIHSFMVLVPLAVFFNYFCLQGLRKSKTDTIMIALIIFALQFLSTAVFPTVDGYRGWLLFGVMLGRFVGVHHPTSEIEVPLDPKRVVIGWIMLLIFVLCFSPKPLMLNIIPGSNG